MNSIELRAQRERLETIYRTRSPGEAKPTFCDVQRALMQLERSVERQQLLDESAQVLHLALSHPLARGGMEPLNAAVTRGRLLQHEYLHILQTLVFLLEVV